MSINTGVPLPAADSRAQTAYPGTGDVDGRMGIIAIEEIIHADGKGKPSE
ncbi:MULTISPECIES: hypothetical protein [unclassified Streptomyces]|nr:MULTISPECIES: hypothetical protein [unclassified Streptomyces]